MADQQNHGGTQPKASLTLTNMKSGEAITVPIDEERSFISAPAIKQLAVLPSNPKPQSDKDTVPCVLYDPGFGNTIACRSTISDVDSRGFLHYRGYPIEELVAKCSYTEVSYLLLHGELPTATQLAEWNTNLLRHTYIHTELERQLQTFRWDSHPMGMLIASVASMSALHPEANPAIVGDGLYLHGPREQYLKYYKIGSIKSLPTAADVRDYVRTKNTYRILGKLPTIAANVYRHREGRPFNRPMPNPSSYTANFLYMIDRLNEDDYQPDPVLVEILDKAFILLAEHGSSCSTITMRHLISTGVDPYSALSGACGTLFGERKCGEVVRMLEEIGSVDHIDDFLTLIKRKKSVSTPARPATTAPLVLDALRAVNPLKPAAPMRLQGWGHRIYRHGADPRVKIMRDLCMRAFQHIYGEDPEQPSAHLIYLALQLERTATKDHYFISRGLFPNIDYWTGVLFHVLGFPPDMHPVLLAIPRASGYLAHAFESLSDKEFKIFRPRQVYLGEELRTYVPVSERESAKVDAQSMLDLDAPSLKSNPAAQVRRSLHEVTTLADVERLITQTRASIQQVTDDLGASFGEPGSSLLVTRLAKRILQAVRPPADSAERDLAKMQSLAQRLSDSQNELRELLDVQRELLALQKSLTQGAGATHPTDRVDLSKF